MIDTSLAYTGGVKMKYQEKNQTSLTSESLCGAHTGVGGFWGDVENNTPWRTSHKHAEM